MKHLNNEGQFVRVPDSYAKVLMEQAGYDVSEIDEFDDKSLLVSEVYEYEGNLFAITEDIIEDEDGQLFMRVEIPDGNYAVQIDESGNELTVEAISIDDYEFFLEGLFEDEEGNLFVALVESKEDDEYDEE